MINLFIAYKNLKIISKPKINLKKNLPELRYFVGYFKVKKSPNMNSPHQMEPFNRKIERFGALNLHQQYFFLHLNPTTSFSSLSNQGLKNNKNKFLYQNKIDKILRHRAFVVSKIKGPNKTFSIEFKTIIYLCHLFYFDL
jgi:hypothetical protein